LRRALTVIRRMRRLSQLGASPETRATLGGPMPRSKTGDDATKNLKPKDETQAAKQGTKIGLLRRSKVMADFKKIVRGKKN
jgi:hypothetical protein